MFLQRISINGEMVSMESFRRIPALGHAIERQFFIYGLNKIRDFPQYNFIHISFYNCKIDEKDYFSFDNYLKELFVRQEFDDNYFLTLSGYSQLKYIANNTYIALNKIFIRDNLPVDILNKAYEKIIDNDYYMIWSTKWIKGVHINLLHRYEYDREIFKIEIIKKKQVIFSRILFIQSPMKYTNDISELGGKQRAILSYSSEFIEPNIFRIKIAHKEYNFILDTFQIEVVEHNELKNEFFDWECIHDGVMFQS